MSAIVLDHAREALIAAERAHNGKQNIQVKNGSLQGRKVIPIEFYLHIAGAVLGGVAAVALTVAAISLSVFTLFAAVAACVVLCLTNALAASFIYQLTPGQEINSVISRLYSKIHDLLKTNQTLKRESESISSTLDFNDFLKYKEVLCDYVKKQDAELEVLQGYFEKLNGFYRKQ
ncbi:MAG: hypothetical protein HWD61_10430 [Parachlamydiaceae bacterium]|nr:MAG: hypothetical protein HWD61_10430 [Parachlamydiaceae bacterium]